MDCKLSDKQKLSDYIQQKNIKIVHRNGNKCKAFLDESEKLYSFTDVPMDSSTVEYTSFIIEQIEQVLKELETKKET